MQIIYIIGAQCCGKTTLSNALVKWFVRSRPDLRCSILCETARKVLQRYSYTRDDIRSGGEKCLSLQKLIMQSQSDHENAITQQNLDVVISDRSGLDPLVYAQMYGGTDAMLQLANTDLWSTLRSGLQRGIVLVCEPVRGWLSDDATRLMPLDWNEWVATHQAFCSMLDHEAIEYSVLPARIQSLQDRVEFVLKHCDIQTGQNCMTEPSCSDSSLRSSPAEAEKSKSN